MKEVPEEAEGIKEVIENIECFLLLIKGWLLCRMVDRKEHGMERKRRNLVNGPPYFLEEQRAIEMPDYLPTICAPSVYRWIKVWFTGACNAMTGGI